MSVNHRPRQMMVVATTGLLIAGMLVSTRLASAGESTCDYDSKTKVLTVTVGPDTPEIIIRREWKDAIKVNFLSCGDATRFNTDEIVVNDPPDHHVSVFIGLYGGQFAPGATDEPGDSDEIEFRLNLSGGSNVFEVRGSADNDIIRVGSTPVHLLTLNLNAAEETGIDDDVVVDGSLNYIMLSGENGGDQLSGKGGAGTGEPYRNKLVLRGSGGNDRLRGGNGADSLNGQGGRDALAGGPGEDSLNGRRGRDALAGGGGEDQLEGDAENDVLNGGAHNDVLYGGSDDDFLDGGPDSDDCDGGGGVNTVVNCE